MNPLFTGHLPARFFGSKNHTKKYAFLLLGLLSSANAETAPANKSSSYYVAPLSYSTTRDTDLPKYAKELSGTGIESLKGIDWLEAGLDYRFRYEYRDDDIRRANAGADEPLLHRTRAYLGVKEILDPFRLAVEVQDARRENSEYPRDNRDVNKAELIRLYGELYFAHALGEDDRGNKRPLSLRYGIHNFEFLDRRLIGNNQWRNTANTFDGFHASLGQEKSDWQLDLLALRPRDRLMENFDTPLEGARFYGAIGHWRKWSEVITLEPYYLLLDQAATDTMAAREVHSPGVRGYGKIGKTGFDYDFSTTIQFGESAGNTMQAFAGTAELGYTIDTAWNPRVSLFYGYASGDKNATDSEDNRFERFYGFSRPWSANDYVVYENISTPKARVELKPSKKLRVDFGYSFYWLASDTDRFANANNARDTSGGSGNFIGHEFDIRARYAFNDKNEITVGYAHFAPGDFIKNRVRDEDTDFAYVEYVTRLF